MAGRGQDHLQYTTERGSGRKLKESTRLDPGHGLQYQTIHVLEARELILVRAVYTHLNEQLIK